MRIFHNRPLALSCIVFALVAVAASKASGIWKMVAAGIVLLLLLIFLFVRTKKRLIFSLCFLFALLALLSSFCFSELQYKRAQSYVGKEITVEGFVLERTYSTPYSSSLKVHVTAVDGKKESFDAQLSTSYASALQIGDIFSVTLMPRAFETDADYEEELYRLSQGELLIMESEDRDSCKTLAGGAADNIRVRLSKLKTRLSYRLYMATGGEAGAVSSALLLGDRSLLSGETSLRFRRTGTSHLLALSGLHVSILIGFAELLLRKMRIPKLVRSILIPLLALGYLCLTGFSLSTVRAVLMACVLYLAFLSRARYDSFTALCVALVLILFVTPYAVWDLSLWMSFLAAASIVIFSPVCQKFLEERKQNWRLPAWCFSLLRGFLTALFVGVIANLGLLLLCAVTFGEISVLSVPVTMLLSIPTSILLPLSALTLLIPALAPLNRFCADLFLSVVKYGSDLKDVLLPVGDSLTLLFIALMTLALILFAVTKMKAKFAVLLVSVFLILGMTSAYLTPLLLSKGISVRCIQTYGGELILFSEKGNTVAVDLANGVEGNAGVIKKAAEEAACTEIDDLIMTRYYNRSPHLIAALSEKIRVRNLRLPTPLNDLEASIAKRLEQEAELHGIEVRYHTRELAIEDFETLCFEHTPMEKDTASQVLVSFKIGKKVFTCLNAAILEGDMGSAARSYLLSSDILLVSTRAKGTQMIPASPDLDRLILGDEILVERFWELPERTEALTVSEFCHFFLK